MSALLTLDGVTAGYGATVVLDGVSLKLGEGGAAVILGRNGVGKTTLLLTVMGHTVLHGGRVCFASTELGGLPTHRRARIGLGLVPQEREIFPSLTVAENLDVAGLPGRWSCERVFEIFPRLAERRHHYGGQLSGGEQQMLSIGRALMGNPRLLLMDEPLEGLAPVIVESLLAAMRRLRDDGLAILLVEQHARRALASADHAVILDRGRIVYDGDSASLREAPERLAALMGVGERR